MVVSDSGSKGGEKGGVGIQLGVIRSDSVKTVFELILCAPECQVRVETRFDRK